MRKILILLFLTFILSGCATYKFQKSGPVANQGYIVSYDDKPILEYTVGKEKSLPDLDLAKQRFKRRRPTVENYYKKMGLIESPFKANFWDPAAMFVDFIFGVFRWPYTAISDYKYNHNPKYKEKIDKLDEEKDVLEKARIDSLKEKLNSYVMADLNKEPASEAARGVLPPVAVIPPETQPVTQAPLPLAPTASTPAVLPQAQPESVVQEPLAQEPLKALSQPPVVPAEPTAAVKITPVAEKVFPPPVAVIIATPSKGYSPLKVNFSGQKSYSKSGKIVSYEWDFGDGDTSAKKNPQNTYWSTTYGTRKFIATLTVKDDKGLTSTATTTTIEVTTR